MAHAPRPVGSTSRLFLRARLDRAGAAAVFADLLALPLLATLGLSIDLGRANFVKARLVTALDSAALTSGRIMVVRDPTASPDQTALSASISATLPTSFLRVLGHNSMTLSARNTVRHTDRGTELVLVMDNTGSMGAGAGSQVEAMKWSATDLTNVLQGGNAALAAS